MRRHFISLLVVLLAACNLANPRPPTDPPPAAPSAAQSILTTTSTPTSPPNLPERPKYTMDVIVDYDRHQVTVDETVRYPNHTGQVLNELTLAIAANLWPNCFSLLTISVNDIPVKYNLSGHRLDLLLPASLEAGAETRLRIRYSLSLPYMDQVNSLRARIFGYSDLQMNLVNWYPYVVPYRNGEWMIREPWSHGEFLVYPTADFEVNLVFSDPASAPVIASSGYAESIGDFTRYTLTDGRAFAISASRDFQVSNMKVGDIDVYSYYLPIYMNAGQAAMYASAQAVQVFSQKFGAYPHKTLTVVMADFSDSMEFSGFYFHSRKFYDLYDGTPASYLTLVAVHETAHQWWFEQVASDQALEPWLDESLATYSESVYYETVRPDLLSWWWFARIDFFKPAGRIDIPVYNAKNDESYKHIVYFNGAHFLQNLRERVGDAAFFAFLQDYYSQGRGKIVADDDFFAILDEHADVDYSDIVKAYFANR